MTVDTTKVRVAITGAVSVAVPGTAAPTDASTALIAAYKDLGAISEDGVTESGSRSTNDIKIWQHGAVARTVITDASLTFQYTMVETNQRTQVEYYGATYNSTTKSMIIDPANSGGRKPHVIDVIDGTNLKRIYAPQAEVTDKGDVVYDASGDAIGYQVTITCYYDSTLGGSAEVFWDDLAA
jgi:hypothetical protein